MCPSTDGPESEQVVEAGSKLCIRHRRRHAVANRGSDSTASVRSRSASSSGEWSPWLERSFRQFVAPSGPFLRGASIALRLSVAEALQHLTALVTREFPSASARRTSSCPEWPTAPRIADLDPSTVRFQPRAGSRRDGASSEEAGPPREGAEPAEGWGEGSVRRVTCRTTPLRHGDPAMTTAHHPAHASKGDPLLSTEPDPTHRSVAAETRGCRSHNSDSRATLEPRTDPARSPIRPPVRPPSRRRGIPRRHTRANAPNARLPSSLFHCSASACSRSGS